MMPRSRTLIRPILVVTVLTSLLFAKKQQKAEHAPLPAKVLQGKTIFIDNQSGWAEMADKAYSALKTWGRFQIVDAKEKADLILVLSATSTQTETTRHKSVTLHNSQTGWTNGSIPVTIPDTIQYSEIKLIDPATGDLMWSDRKEWSKRHSATQVLLESLRQRIEEQDKQAAH